MLVNPLAATFLHVLISHRNLHFPLQVAIIFITNINVATRSPKLEKIIIFVYKELENIHTLIIHMDGIDHFIFNLYKREKTRQILSLLALSILELNKGFGRVHKVD